MLCRCFFLLSLFAAMNAGAKEAASQFKLSQDEKLEIEIPSHWKKIVSMKQSFERSTGMTVWINIAELHRHLSRRSPFSYKKEAERRVGVAMEVLGDLLKTGELKTSGAKTIFFGLSSDPLRLSGFLRVNLLKDAVEIATFLHKQLTLGTQARTAIAQKEKEMTAVGKEIEFPPYMTVQEALDAMPLAGWLVSSEKLARSGILRVVLDPVSLFPDTAFPGILTLNARMTRENFDKLSERLIAKEWNAQAMEMYRTVRQRLRAAGMTLKTAGLRAPTDFPKLHARLKILADATVKPLPQRPHVIVELFNDRIETHFQKIPEYTHLGSWEETGSADLRAFLEAQPTEAKLDEFQLALSDSLKKLRRQSKAFAMNFGTDLIVKTRQGYEFGPKSLIPEILADK